MTSNIKKLLNYKDLLKINLDRLLVLTNCNIKITDINYNELTINDLHSRINQLDKYHDTCGNYLLIDKNDERIKRIN